MCERIPGELLLCIHRQDMPAKEIFLSDLYNERIAHVKVIESLRDRLDRMDLKLRDDIEFEFYRLQVPSGEEEWKVNYLQFYYKLALLEALSRSRLDAVVMGTTNYHPQIAPHSFLQTCDVTPSPYGAVALTQTHEIYKRMLRMPTTRGNGSAVKTLVLDTGIGPGFPCNAAESRDFTADGCSRDVVDENGHGTAVAAIIRNMCPSADMVVYKVADKDGFASEWNVLAALAAGSGARVVNISLQFGLAKIDCPACGRASPSTRSAVFENMIGQVGKSPQGTVVVAAAGNQGRRQLSFPARFGSVLAIGSLDAGGNLSSFTNASNADHEGKRHENVFVLPGGQKDRDGQASEYPVESSTGMKFCGTSFAAAYASGLIGALWSMPEHRGKNSGDIVARLRATANTNLPGYDPGLHGNGLMQLS